MAIDSPALEQAIHRLALSESGFVFDPVSGLSFTVNETGLNILRQLQHNPDIQKAHKHLLQHYDANQQELLRDLEDFIAAVGEHLGLQ